MIFKRSTIDSISAHYQIKLILLQNYGNDRLSGSRNSDYFSLPYFLERNGSFPVIYDVLQLTDTTWSVVGQWTSNGSCKEQLFMVRGSKSIRPVNRLKVATVVQNQFSYFENSNETDPSKLQGYAVDLLEELSRLEGFEYDLQLVKDGQYGILNETSGQWTGMIGEVARGEADMAIGAITATKQRHEVVDFLPNFMTLHLDFVVKRSFESNYKYNPYAFFDPFDLSFYRALLVSILCLSIVLPALSTLSPYGIRGRFFQSSKADQSREVDNAILAAKDYSELSKRHRRIIKERQDAQWNMGINNAMFLLWSALFCKSPERIPQSLSAKIIILTWYFASTVIVASYTANVVTSVSLHARDIEYIQSVEDLLLQSTVGYGALENGIVVSQLKESQTSVAKQLYHSIVGHDKPLHMLVPTVGTALDLAKKGKFAYISDSIFLDLHAVESNCELKTVPLGFGLIGYAVPVRRSLPLFKSLSSHMRVLKRNGFLEHLWKKYFQFTQACSNVSETDNRLRSLTYTDLAGVFYVVATGLIAGCIVLVIEWFVACFHDMTSLKANPPQTLTQAFRIRRKRFVRYLFLNWFPLQRWIQKWKKLDLPTQELSETIVANRLRTSEQESKLDCSRLWQVSPVRLRSPLENAAENANVAPFPEIKSIFEKRDNSQLEVKLSTAKPGLSFENESSTSLLEPQLFLLDRQ